MSKNVMWVRLVRRNGRQTWHACARALDRMLTCMHTLRLHGHMLGCYARNSRLLGGCAFHVWTARHTHDMFLNTSTSFMCTTTLVLGHLVQCPKTEFLAKILLSTLEINNSKSRSQMIKLPSPKLFRIVSSIMPPTLSFKL